MDWSSHNVMTVASKIVYVASAFLTFLGIALYYFMNLSKSRKWLEFSRVGDKLGEDDYVL